MSESQFVPVWLDGIPLWADRNALQLGGSGALAPEHHIKDGDIADFKTAMFGNGDSYAHVFPDGTIRRYGQPIGTRDDLKPRDASARIAAPEPA